MKLSKNKNKIVGVMLKDLSFPLVKGADLIANFLLIDEEVQLRAEASLDRGWPEEVRNALSALVLAMETHQLSLLFGEEAPEVVEEQATPVISNDIKTF